MKFYKQIENGYILAIGENMGGVEITEAEYDEILSVIRSKPPREGDTDYRLREDLTWQSYIVEPDPEPDLDGDEIAEILLGGAPE